MIPSGMADTERQFFATTRWTLVRAAAENGHPGAVEALGDLLERYWQPLYRHARRKGKSPEDAQDLVQGFYARLVRDAPLGGLDRTRGTFRSFLLASFNNWMINEWRDSKRLKRGGGETLLSLDWEEAETGLKFEVSDERTPDRLFDRDWAHELLGRVLSDLRASCKAEGNEAQFEQLRASLAADSSRLPYAQLAANLHISEGAARVAVHRLRKRYRMLLREEIDRTLSDDGSVEEEMKALFAALAE